MSSRLTLRALPPRLSLARLPTPLRQLTRYSAQFSGTRVWVKHDELTGTEVSGNKVRKLEFSIAEARAQGCDTLITCGGLQSNHCRSTAILGARLGMKVFLILRGESHTQPDGNLLLDHLAGAQIHYLPADQWHTHESFAADLAEKIARRAGKAFFIPTGASDEIGLWGYVAASEELHSDLQQHDLEPDAIVTATGSGGTQAGLIVGNALYGLADHVLAINVCDDARYFHDKIRQDFARWQARYAELIPDGFTTEDLPINTVEGYMGPGYAQATPEVFECIRELARTEGLFLDPVYTGKAFLGMHNEIVNGRLRGARDVVFIHTGGLFGLFPQKAGFSIDL